MEKFIKLPAMVKHFERGEGFCLTNVGYNDFHVVRASHSFRVEKNYMWHFVLGGKGVLEIGGRCSHLAAGDMFFSEPNLPLSYYPDPDDPWDYVWFNLKGDAAARYGELLGFSLQSAALKCRHFQKVRHILQDMFEALLLDECGYFGVLSVFYQIMELCSTDHRGEEIQSVKRMIDGSFTLPSFSIEQLCRDAGVSHAQLLRRFKKAYGTTVIAYVVRKRIELACELLEATDLPVYSIAFSCGFADEIHFMKTFKAQTGLSATLYRRLHAAQNRM